MLLNKVADSETGFANQTKNFEIRLQKIESQLEGRIAQLMAEKKIPAIQDLSSYNNDHFAILAYHSDTLTAWSNRKFSEAAILSRLKTDTTVALPMNNGYYMVKVRETEFGRITGIIPIYTEYRYNNWFLINGFPLLPALEGTYAENSDPNLPSTPIRDLGGNTLGYIIHDSGYVHPSAVTWLGVAAFGFSILGLFLSFHQNRLSIFGIHPFLLLLVGIFVWRYFFVNYSLDIFDPFGLFQSTRYANRLFAPSLGVLITSLVIAFFAILAWYRKPMISPKLFKRLKLIEELQTGLYFLFLLIIGFLMVVLIKSLLLDSQINLDISRLQEFDAFSVFGLICIVLIFGTHLLISYRILRKVAEFDLRWFTVLVIALFSLVAGAIIIAVVLRYDFLWFFPLWYSVYGAFVYFLLKRAGGINQLIELIGVVALFSVLSAYYYNLYDQQKTEGRIRQIVENLSSQEDPLAEYLIEEARNKIQQDRSIINQLQNPFLTPNNISDRVKSLYLKGYLKSFTHNVQVNRDLEPGYRIDTSAVSPSNSKFNTLIYEVDVPVYDHGELLGLIRLNLNTSKLPDDKTFYSEYTGNASVDHVTPRRFSFAIYKNGRLSYTSGSEPYTAITETRGSPGSFKRILAGNDNVYLYAPNENDFITLRVNRREQVRGFYTMFSYNFALLVLAMFAGLLFFSRLFTKNIRLFTESLKNRIQFAVLALLFFTLIIIAFASYQFVKKEIEGNEVAEFETRIQQIIDNFHDQHEESVAFKPDFINYLNTSFSNSPDDIHFYGTNGKLEFSSNPVLFEDNIWPGRADPIALGLIRSGRANFYFSEEKIGSYKYLGFYSAVRDSDQNLVGVLYLPNFRLKNKTTHQLRFINVTLTNVFTSVLLLATLASLLVTFSVTRILEGLRNQLARVQIGKEYTPLQWKNKDEIGLLVDEYNAMVKKLEESAIILARTERESAWRDMAKQVAHEIKNPLTPMKLSIQHLGRALTENGGETELERKTLNTLTQQIDHLSRIAEGFSQLAKMPLPVNQKLDLKKMVKNAVNLFSSNQEYDVTLDDQITADKAWVYADSAMINSVLNNVLKNSQQAMVKDRPGKISVEMSLTNEKYVIAIKDNGRGIPLENRAKIFTPNFTTKSSGSGLGLMMSKKIIEMAKGHIYFESKKDQGTIFFIELPKVVEEEKVV